MKTKETQPVHVALNHRCYPQTTNPLIKSPWPEYSSYQEKLGPKNYTYAAALLGRILLCHCITNNEKRFMHKEQYFEAHLHDNSHWRTFKR